MHIGYIIVRPFVTHPQPLLVRLDAPVRYAEWGPLHAPPRIFRDHDVAMEALRTVRSWGWACCLHRLTSEVEPG